MGTYRGYKTSDLRQFTRESLKERGVRDSKEVYKDYKRSGGKLTYLQVVKGVKPYKKKNRRMYP